MASTSYKITGIAPPDLDFYGPEVRKLFWKFVVLSGLKAKGKDIIAGLDKEGMPLNKIKPKTRKYRRSEMTPSGKGDPAAPPLIPGWQKSRTYSLLAGRAFTSHAEFYWRFDAFTAASWGEILKHQAERYGRDVIGLSPVGLARVRVQSWDWWNKYKAGHALPSWVAKELTRLPKAEAPRPPSRIERPRGGMTGPEWRAYFRQTAAADLPGRPAKPVVRSPIAGPKYNVLLGHVWGTGGTRPGAGPGTAAPIPVPRPSPLTPVPKRRVAMPPKPTQPASKPVSAALDTTRAGAVKAEADYVIGLIDRLHGVGNLKRIPLTDKPDDPGSDGTFAYFRKSPLYWRGRANKIGISPTSDIKQISIAHEIGHFIESFGIPGGPASSRDWEKGAFLAEWKQAITKTEAWTGLNAMVGKETVTTKLGNDRPVYPEVTEYLLRWNELWARSYAQWVATRSESPVLKTQINAQLSRSHPMEHHAQWSDEDFEPVAQAIDKLFRGLQWMK